MSKTNGLGSLAPKTHTLESGLVATTLDLPSLHRSVIVARIRIGSRYECSQNNGISHFLEHMLFRGTPSHASAFELARAFEALGGTLEGGTAEDHGILSISVPPESLLATLNVFCSVIGNPLLSEPEVERDIVREEILEGLDDEGNDIDVSLLARKLCFGDHPLGFSILGSPETLDTFEKARLKAHHRLHYTGKNLALVLAGPLDHRAALETATKQLATLPAGELPNITPVPQQAEPRFHFTRHKASQTSLSLCYRAPGNSHRLEPATEMLMRVIDDGMSTRLYHRICDQLGLCYDTGAGYQAFDDVGVVEFAADTAHERAGVLLRELLQIADALAQHGPTDAELSRARQRCRWQFQAMLDEPEALAHFYAEAALSGKNESPSARCEALCDASQAELRAAAETVFQSRGRSIAAVGLQKPKQLAELEQLAQT